LTFVGRVVAQLVGLADGLVDVAAQSARTFVDETAVWWLMQRRLPRDQAAPLLERLGEQLGAKVEYSEDP